MNSQQVKNTSNRVTRISMSLPTKLLKEFDKSTSKAGFSDRSKAIQAAIHAFVDINEWNGTRNQSGAGAIVLLYDNHIYNQNRDSVHLQHHYSDVISASNHIHLDQNNCLETIMVKGRVSRIKALVRVLSQNGGIKSIKFQFMTLV